MEKFNYGKTLKELGISYLGNVAQSMKLRLSYEHGTMTYCVYLAPWNMSGHQVCAFGANCHQFCLNGSGQNKCDELSRGVEGSKINRSRIKKTRLFFDSREKFMDLLTHEIRRYKESAKRKGFGFSVRLNGTSDLSPLAFKYKDGRNILDIFPDVQFYDYTKNPNRFKLCEKYHNYDLTFSYDGYNWDKCEEVLNHGGKVAVVFYGGLPKTYKGFKVWDANEYDMRYLDPKNHIMGLHYHKTASDYQIGKDGKRHFVVPNTPFVVKLVGE